MREVEKKAAKIYQNKNKKTIFVRDSRRVL